MKFAELSNNIWSISVLFGEGNEALILSFLNCFKENNLIRANVINSRSSFHFLDFNGSNSEHRTIYAYDENNSEHIFDIHLLNMHKNMPYNELRLSDENYNNKKKNYLKDGKVTASINVIAFFNDNVENENNYLSQKNYILGKPFEKLYLNCIYLKNFKEVNPDSTNLEKWIYLFRKSYELTKMPKLFKNSIFEKALKTLEIKNWSKFYKNEYNDEKESKIYHQKNSNDILSLIMYKNYFDDLSVFNQEYDSIKLNYKLLEKELGFYPKFYIDKDEIKLTAFDNNLEKFALELFEKWKSNALKKFPHFNFEIIDEKVIVSNVREDLQSAILSLLVNNKYLRGTYSNERYIGYVWGYLIGRLSTAWNHEYIAQKTDDYKKLSAIKAIKDYLKLDKVKAKQLDKLYEAYLVLDSNIKNPDFTIAETDLRKGSVELEKTGEYGQLMVILNNIVDDFLIKITNEEYGNFLDDEPIMYEELIEQMIKENKDQFDL